MFGLAGFYGVVGMGNGSLPLGVARILDRFREEHLSGEPDWEPLEGVLPAEWWGGFMWIQRLCAFRQVDIDSNAYGGPGSRMDIRAPPSGDSVHSTSPP